MNHLKKITVVIVIFTSAISCSTRRLGMHGKENNFSNQEQELEYYYAFTEATKQAMFNNYKDAINLYNKCLKYNPKSAATYFQISNIYMRLGEIELAKVYGRNAIKRESSNIWYYLHLASIYQMQGKIDSTIVMYEKIIELDDKKTEYLFNLALLYNEGKNYDKALKVLTLVENEVGVNERIIYLKHDLYSKLGKKKEAVKELKEGIGYYPDNINIRGLLAEYYSEIGEYENADILYQQILKLDSTNSKVILSYADYLIGLGKKELAFSYYQNAIEDPNMLVDEKILIVVSLVNDDKIFNDFKKELEVLVDDLRLQYFNNIEIRAICIDFNIKSLNYKGASKDLNYVVKNKPDNLNAWKQLIYIENYLNNYDTVLYLTEKALALFREEVTFYIMKGLASMQMGNNEDAIDILLKGGKYAKRTEEKTQIFGYLAELYRNIGNDDLSDNYFEMALKNDEKNILIRNNYSYYLALRDTALKKAEKLSRYTIEQEPQNSTYLDTYAWILFKMKKYRNALKFIEKAVKNDEGFNGEIWDHYGDILYNLNKYEKAIAVWQRILEVNGISRHVEEKIKKSKKLIRATDR